MRILLPTQTRFVTPGSTELHFYSDRHVRDRVRLHLRRVTENNNRERRTRETTTEKISSIDRTRVKTERTGKSRRPQRKRWKTTDVAEEIFLELIWACARLYNFYFFFLNNWTRLFYANFISFLQPHFYFWVCTYFSLNVCTFKINYFIFNSTFRQ